MNRALWKPISIIACLLLAAGLAALVSRSLGGGGDEPAPTPPARIAERGRLTLDRSALSGARPLVLVLELTDEARGSGPRPVRIVSQDGRRLDATATPVSGTGSGLRLEVDSDFLRPGRYLIELSSAERRPLNLRRYVLELR